MQRLTPAVRAYAWGSHTLLPELCGTTSPSPHPVAEHWFGAHSSGPARCPDGEGLDGLIAAHPEAELGEPVLNRYGGHLPYLVKLLAAEQPLSLQAHPSLEQAREGFARENAQGLPLDAPTRNYRDPNHKPEVLVALSEFHALAGFRPVDRTIELFDALAVPALRPYRDMLDGQPDESGIRAVFTTFVTMPDAILGPLVAEVVTAAVGLITSGAEERFRPVATTVVELGERYPADPGVLGALLLNRIELRPGEALYLGAGNLHAYLHGIGVEVMASSDNVLRGGLTPKHVDVPELVRVLDFAPVADPVVRPVPRAGGVPGEVDYPTPAPDFTVSRITLAPGATAVPCRADGPEILLCTDGEVTVGSGEGGEDLRPGGAVWLPAGSDSVELSSPGGGTLFRSRVGSAAGQGAATR